jgi:hypothetical protein
MISKCIECEIEFKYFPSQQSGKYCSNRCQGNHLIKQRFVLGSKWVNGMSLFLKTMRGEQCEVCGITEYNKKPIVFQIDHINGNRFDNRFENLRVICPNCHSQTETWGVKNMSEAGREKCRAAACKTNKNRYGK